MKKSRTLKVMTPETIGKISLLMSAGLNSNEIAATLEIGKSTVQRYMTILATIRDGQPIPFRTDVYKAAAVEEYCKRHGLEYKPKAEEEKQPEKHEIDPRLHGVYDCANNIEQIADVLKLISMELMQIYGELAEEAKMA